MPVHSELGDAGHTSDSKTRKQVQTAFAKEWGLLQTTQRSRALQPSPEATRPDRSAKRVNRLGGRAGFTLIELMVVIATIGAIVSLAVPSLQKYVHRAQRNEAYLNLKGIYKAQLSFFLDHGRYGSNFDELGFEISGARQVDPNTIESRFYTYTVTSFPVDGRADANFQAVATADLDPSDDMMDILLIENDIIVVD